MKVRVVSLPDALIDDLGKILRPRRLTDLDDLFREFAQALDGYDGRAQTAARRATQRQQLDAARRLIATATTLQRDIRHADAMFPIKGKWFIPTAWESLEPPVQAMIDAVTEWVERQASLSPRPRRGRPHDGIGVFRVRVLGALKDAGIPITNPKGKAARILARLLEEIDRRDGIPPSARLAGDFSGTQWKRWVDDVQFVDAARADCDGRRLSMTEWARTRGSTFVEEWNAARKRG